MVVSPYTPHLQKVEHECMMMTKIKIDVSKYSLIPPWDVVGPKTWLNWKTLRVLCGLNGSQTITEPSFPICSTEEKDSELRSGLIRQKTLIFPTEGFSHITQTITPTEKSEREYVIPRNSCSMLYKFLFSFTA